jgi:hypothetical protein
MYYSHLSQSGIDEIQAHAQIIELCERWYNIAHPQGDFVKYLKNHTDLLDIERWNCFIKLDQ